MDAREITDALGGKWNASTAEGSACCPAHEDRHPSLSLADGYNGEPVVRCHKGCEFRAVRAALEARQLWPKAEPIRLRPFVSRNGAAAVEALAEPAPLPETTNGTRRIMATYDYCDEQGAVMFQAVRYEPKDFRQRQPDGQGGWLWSLKEPPVRLVLYRLPELLAAAPTRHVFVEEGEKDAEALRALGLVATTNPMGAKKWRPEFSESLRGRRVVILPDHDKTGEEHAEQVLAALLPVADTVKVVRLPGLSDKEDVSDWLGRDGSRDALELLVRQTDPIPASTAQRYPIRSLGALLRVSNTHVPQIVEDIIWADRITWAFAAPGAGKTIFLLAAGMHVAAGRPFCGKAVQQMPVLLIEEDSPFSVLAEYTETLADIYEFDLDALPFWTNEVQGLRLTDTDGADLVFSAVEQCPERPGLILLDACERLVPSERFTSKELDPLTRLLQQLVIQKVTPNVIDHTRRPGKVEPNGKAPNDPMEFLYGGRSKQAIADVMMFFSGTPRTQMRISYPKFRGETPQPLDLTFAPDTGFDLKPQPRTPRTPTEQKLLGWFASVPMGWQALEAIQAGTGLPDRSLRRALEALVYRKWLEKEGTKKQGTQYRSNPHVPVVFQ